MNALRALLSHSFGEVLPEASDKSYEEESENDRLRNGRPIPLTDFKLFYPGPDGAEHRAAKQHGYDEGKQGFTPRWERSKSVFLAV